MRRRGFVILVVLGALAGLSVLLATGLSQALADRRAARRDLAVAQVRLAAEGAAEMGLARGGAGSGHLGDAGYSFSSARYGPGGATLVKAEAHAGDLRWAIEVVYTRGARGAQIVSWRENP